MGRKSDFIKQLTWCHASDKPLTKTNDGEYFLHVIVSVGLSVFAFLMQKTRALIQYKDIVLPV